MHPLIPVNVTTKRLEGALKLITENPNGDIELEKLAKAIRQELNQRRYKPCTYASDATYSED
jgi:hypothetical protein